MLISQLKGTVTQQIFPGQELTFDRRGACPCLLRVGFPTDRELDTDADADESSHKLTFLANAMIWGFSDARSRFMSPDLVKNDSKNYKIRQQ
jgi:hypothetical protein